MFKFLKKVLIFVLIMPCLILFGCGKKKNEIQPDVPPDTSQQTPHGGQPSESQKPEEGGNENPVQAKFKINVDFNLPNDVKEKFASLFTNSSQTLNVGENFTLPLIDDEKLEPFFENWFYVSNDENIDIDGTTITFDEGEFTVFAKWKDGFDDFLQDEYYTDGLTFDVLNESAIVTGFNGNKSVISIPSTYNNLPVNEIKENAFKDNNVVCEVILNSFVKINSSAFENSSIEKIDLSKTRFIGDGAFKNSSLSEEFIAYSGLTYLGESAFEESLIEQADLSACALTEIYQNTFKNSSLKAITFPSSMTIINKFAFSGCEMLENIDSIFELNNLTEIGERAFENCVNLTSIKLNQNLQILRGNVFDGCSKVKSIELTSLYNNVSSDNFTILFGNLSNIETITLTGDLIKNIPRLYFSNLTSLKTFNMNDVLETISNYAFLNCENLETIKFSPMLSANNFDISVFENTAWFKNFNELLVFDDTLVFVPESFILLQENGLIDLSNESFTKIGKNAFFSSLSVKNVKFSNKITEILSNAFANCENLESINFDENCEILKIDEYAFLNCLSLRNVNLENLIRLETIGEEAFFNTSLNGQINLPSSLTLIGKNAFSKTQIEAFSISDNENFQTDESGILFKTEEGGKTSIFIYPDAKTDEVLKLDENIVKICSNSFYLNSNLKYIFVPAEVELTVERDAFQIRLPKIINNSNNLTSASSKNVYSLLGDENYTASFNDVDGVYEIQFTQPGLEMIEQSGLTCFMIQFEGKTLIFNIDASSFEILDYSITDISFIFE